MAKSSNKKPKPTDDNTDRKGINAVEKAFLELGWAFREQPIKDFGVDAQVEVVKDGEPTGKLIALQIKSGKSFFKPAAGGGFRYSGTLKHLSYWTRHSLPVFILLHDPETGKTYWQRIERRLVKESAKGWSIVVPKENILGEEAVTFLSAGIASDPEAIRRFRFALDKDLMREFAAKKNVYLRIFDYYNKG